MAVTVTRNCIGIWDLLTGKLNFKLADSALGAIVTHALVTSDGEHIAAAESGFVIYWDTDLVTTNYIIIYKPVYFTFQVEGII